ncbi:MAG TPA: S4 domain-containing protein, partial [Bacteroidales bacterium]|nr:S4 domain-containing protein [Bacteroidales bacterium]
ADYQSILRSKRIILDSCVEKYNYSHTMNVRVDKYLFSVRLYKTRNEATTACRNGSVIVNDNRVKPSYIIKQGDKIEVRINPIFRTFTVIQINDKRCSNALVSDYISETTPTAELERLRIARSVRNSKPQTRPNKKDRRILGKLFEQNEIDPS